MRSSTNASPSAIVPADVVMVPGRFASTTAAHPAAELFPLMKDTDLGLLVEDIDEQGLREPILVYQGFVVDGRNRLREPELRARDLHRSKGRAAKVPPRAVIADAAAEVHTRFLGPA